MNFFDPLGFLGLLTLPVIIILYTVKQKSKVRSVSSLYLWQKIQTDKSGTSFFKRLKNNPFLYLDLLLALLLTLALTEAYIHREPSNGSMIIVIDNSLTMQSEDVKPTRLDEAKKQACSLIDGKDPKKTVSIVTLCRQPQIKANRQTDKFLLKNAVNSIEATYSGADTQKTAALIDSLNAKDTTVYVFGDGKNVFDGCDYIDVGTDNANCAVTALNARANGDGGVSIFAVAENMGSEPVEKSVNIFADNKIIDSFLVTIQPNSKTQVLADTDFMPSEAVAELSPSDSLAVDDTRYYSIASDSIKKALLITKGNTFLERALNAQPDVELYKGSEYSGAQGYDYYIFDGITAEKYPADGDLLFFGVDEQTLFKTTENKEITQEIESVGRGNYFNELNFGVRTSYGIESSQLEPMLTEGERTVMAQGKINGQSVFVCGFDLHDSDLPLKMDFPILIYNILNDFDNSGLGARQFTAGETTAIDLRADTVKAEIEDPEGRKTELLNTAFTPAVCGFYKLYENDRQTAELAVNCQPDTGAAGVVAGSDERVRVNYKLRKIFIILALLVIAVELLLYFMRMRPDPRVVLLRVMIFVLTVMSIADISFSSETTRADTVFVLDSSDSMRHNQKKALDFINSAMQQKPDGDYTALMVFGGNAAVDSGLSPSKASYTPTSVIDASQTDIEKAVNTADGLFGDERGRHMVLLTDGRETSGSISALKEENAVIDVVDLSEPLEKEVQITRLGLPSKINKNTDYSVTLQIDSLTAQECGVELYKNDKVIYKDTLKLEKGKNRFVVKDHADEANNVVYKCVIDPAEDTYDENNTVYKHTYIQDAPVVMVLERQGSGSNIYDLVTSFGVNARRADISAYAQHPENLGQNDLVIIADCPADMMTDEFLNSLEGYVKNSAGGLLVTGGRYSFALGEYKDTVLEDILPVNMDMKNDEIQGDVAFFMVTDRSGSMGSGEGGKDKLTMAKEAMAGAVKNLHENDTVAVIAFDTNGEWVVKPTKIGKEPEKIVRKIAGISVGGGTSILPSLDMAYKAILKNDSAYKHIILLTDGQAETEGYDPIIEKMAENKITLSTIAVGEGADTELLEGLAKKGGGRYYFADEFSNLPNIFSREAKLAGRDYIVNETFFPSITADDDILKNVEQLPSLNGYIATDGKEAAKAVLSSETGDPVLSYWQYGLGRTAVFTSDMQNYCGDWLSSTEGRLVLKNLTALLMRSPAAIDGEVSYSESGEKGYVTISFNNAPQSVEGGSINGQSLDFVQTSVGEYRAETEKQEKGSYVINAVFTDKDGNERVVNDGVDIGYSKEFDINLQKNALENLNAPNISFITDPYSVFARRKYTAKHSLVLYIWLLPLALLLLLAEIFLRRIGAVKLPERQKKARPKKAVQNLPDEDNTAHTLLSNKRNRKK